MWEPAITKKYKLGLLSCRLICHRVRRDPLQRKNLFPMQYSKPLHQQVLYILCCWSLWIRCHTSTTESANELLILQKCLQAKASGPYSLSFSRNAFHYAKDSGNFGRNSNGLFRFGFFRPEYSGSHLEPVHLFRSEYSDPNSPFYFHKPALCPK